MKSLTMVFFVLASASLPTLAMASGEPSSLDCFFQGARLSFGLDASSDSAVDDLLVNAAFFVNAKETGNSKKDRSDSDYVGQISSVNNVQMGTRTDTSSVTTEGKDDALLSSARIDANYKDADGNVIKVTATHATWDTNKTSDYSFEYPAFIYIKLAKIDQTGGTAGTSLKDIPQGAQSGNCFYNPGQ